jgi:glycosyltransferase involved in cell wall biosynthesis
MAAGVPVISTPLGAEGLDVIANTNILIAHPDDEASWVNHLSELLKTRELGTSLADRALELIQARYDWKVLGQKLSQTYRAWLNDRV